MALTNAAMVVAATALQGAYGYAALHSASGGGNGASNEITAAGREAITWGSITGAGDFDLGAQLDFTGMDPDQPVYSVSIWTADTAGTCGGEFVLTGDSAANAAGEYSVTSISLDGSAT